MVFKTLSSGANDSTCGSCFFEHIQLPKENTKIGWNCDLHVVTQKGTRPELLLLSFNCTVGGKKVGISL